MGNVVTKEYVKELLAKNDKAVVRALAVLFSYQTADEQRTDHTCHENGKGFNHADARMLSSMAKFAAKTGFLTVKQLAYLRNKNRIYKYAGQLATHANENTKTKAV